MSCLLNSRVPYHLRDKYSVSKRSHHTYRLTLWNITREDAGKYVCRVGVSSGATTVRFVASGTATVDVFYLPDLRVSPHCSLINHPSEQLPEVGETIHMQCLSQGGNPIVGMRWSQNGKGEISNSRVSKPSSSDGIVVAVLDVTILPEHMTAVFTCEITSLGFPSFSHSCTVGPFVSPSVTPPLTHPRFGSTTKLIKSQNSIGESDEGMFSPFKIPVFAGVAGLMCLLIIIIAVVVVKRRRHQTKESQHRDSQAHLVTHGVNGVEKVNVQRDIEPVQHKSAPNGGPMYAVVQKSKLEENDDYANKNMPDVLSRAKTLPIVSIAPNHNKSYPPPPSYPTEQQQHEINQLLDKNSNSSVAKYSRARNGYQNASIASSSPSQNRENRRQTEPNLSSHEYATLEEFAAQESPLPPRSKRNSTGLYNTVNLY